MEEARQQVETNFFGVVRMNRQFLPLLREQGHGRIITISSLAGLIGVPFQAFYSAAKHYERDFAVSSDRLPK